MDRSLEEILKTFDKLHIFPEDLAHRTNAIEITAKDMCNDRTSKIQFKYIINDKAMKFFCR